MNMNKDLFIQKADNFIREEGLITPGDAIVMGVSGGADSVCLFKVLKELESKYDLKLTVVCIYHGLRPEGLTEQQYVEALCKREGVRFVGKSIDVKGFCKEKGIGSEEAGRILRYRIFEEIADECGENAKIAVAHNANDVAETFLFNLFRGTGPKGLAALKPKRDRIIRPLLCMERSEIEDYLNREGIKFYTDHTNLEDDYTRNRIRHHILEYAAKEINPSSIRHVYEASERIGEANDILENMAIKELCGEILNHSDREVIIKRSALTDTERYLACIKVKKCIDMLVPHNKDIMAGHLNAVCDIATSVGTAFSNLPYRIRVTASFDKVCFSKDREEETRVFHRIEGESGSLRIEGLGTISWQVEDRGEDFSPSTKLYTKSFDYDKINDCLNLRNCEDRDYLTVNAKLQRKKLSDYFTNEKVPVFERTKKLVLADKDHVWWVVGMRISEYPKVIGETKKIITFHIDKEDSDGEASC